MAQNFLDIFSVGLGRELRFEWPSDLRECEVTDILEWLEILERKIVRSSNRNEEMSAKRLQILTGEAPVPANETGGSSEASPAGKK